MALAIELAATLMPTSRANGIFVSRHRVHSCPRSSSRPRMTWQSRVQWSDGDAASEIGIKIIIAQAPRASFQQTRHTKIGSLPARQARAPAASREPGEAA
jgi:hypothetical protein